MVRSATLLGSVALAFALPSSAAAQAPAEIASETDGTGVAAAARAIVAERYVVPETAARLDAALAEAVRRGDFTALSGEALAAKINAVMRTVTADGHLSVSWNPAMSAELAAAGPPQDGEEQMPAEFLRQIQRDNAGVRRLEVLPGNIRYLDYRGFWWGTPAAEQAIAAAMEFLRDGDALIIDLRNNGGGSPQAVAAMTSYFLPPDTALARFESRGRPGEASRTTATPFSLAGKPLFVLTSRSSFSAAEEFATHVSAFGFGTLVGATTGGGGLNNEFFPLPGGLVISVSTGRPVHAVTGGDWEAVGVAPKIAVAPDKALVRAQVEASAAVLATLSGAERAAGERQLAYYRALETPVAPALPLAAYTGTYGDRTVEAVDGALVMRRGNRPPARLVALGPNLFAPDAAPAQRVGFAIENGAVVALELDNGQGPASRVARQPA
jgi:hypothetical protein